MTPAGIAVSGANATQALSVEVRDGTGNVVASPSVTWTSLNLAVATVSAAGVVTAVGAGQATIVVTSGAVSATALVTVSVPGATPVNLWAPMASGTTQWLGAVWGVSATNVFAVGLGTIRRYDGSNWLAMASGTGTRLLGAWGASGRTSSRSAVSE